MLLSLTIRCCKILQLKLFFSTLSNFKSKMTITGTLTITESFTLDICFPSGENEQLTTSVKFVTRAEGESCNHTN